MQNKIIMVEYLITFYSFLGGILGGLSVGMAFYPLFKQPKNIKVQIAFAVMSLLFLFLVLIIIIYRKK